ncbi:MAG: rhomboid family intramembrane serine protease [Actinobacteria bacterium]|nr:rhomboid family intramembrane serine protease [Actinomycetota bacterium]MBV8563258.1 rhomboid family intramembrane serine protease [Actinomycetota bacterium]
MSTTETKYCYRHPDRPTGLSCSECGRPICTECMTPAAVGLRCPEHAGGRQSRIQPRPVRRAPGVALATNQAPVTRILIAINVGMYLLTAIQSHSTTPTGSIVDKFLLYGPYVHDGQWWRLITSMFLHASILHIAFNMFALYAIGTPVEQYLGRARYIGLYFVSGLAGSAGALLQTPTTPVLGASGAIFGILGAMLIIEWQVTGRLAGNAMTWIVINLGISIAVPNISWGGHVGGLIGGILVTLAYAGWSSRGRAAYGQLGLGGIAGLVGVAAASIAIAYWKVRGLA